MPGLHDEDAGVDAADGVRHNVDHADEGHEHGKPRHEAQQIHAEADDRHRQRKRERGVVGPEARVLPEILKSQCIVRLGV